MDGEAPVLRLAADIAAQFRHLPDDEAATAVASHIRTFWDPRMRTRFAELAPATDDPLLHLVAAHLFS